jgi:predicted alpha/beta superfamily hydrolase
MKKFIFSAMMVVFLLLCSNRIQAQTTQTKPAVISFGTKDVINSKILNEQREIWVYVPSSASDTIFSKQRFPVVYLLDGDSHFASVVGMIQQLSSSNVCPEMIVVGIPNTDRTRDLTPTHMLNWQFLNSPIDSNFFKNSGGGEKFMSFIEKELMPHIDSLYPTATYRMLIGHSFGGLTVMNTLIHNTNLFNAYVAIDPAMSWDNQKLLKETKKALATNTYSGVSLFLGIANTMGVGMDTIKIKKDTTKATEHIRSLFELRNYLNYNKQNQLKSAYRYYNNDNHMSIPLNAEYDALRFIFNYYHLDFFSDDYKNIENLYENVSKHFGYKVKPPENMVNSLAYTYLYLKYFDKANYLFKLNVTNYPDSYNVFDSMGDFYTAKSDKANAIYNYKRALLIKEVPDTRKKLEKLQGK